MHINHLHTSLTPDQPLRLPSLSPLLSAENALATEVVDMVEHSAHRSTFSAGAVLLMAPTSSTIWMAATLPSVKQSFLSPLPKETVLSVSHKPRRMVDTFSESGLDRQATPDQTRADG